MGAINENHKSVDEQLNDRKRFACYQDAIHKMYTKKIGWRNRARMGQCHHNMVKMYSGVKNARDLLRSQAILLVLVILVPTKSSIYQISKKFAQQSVIFPLRSGKKEKQFNVNIENNCYMYVAFTFYQEIRTRYRLMRYFQENILFT